MRLEATTLIQSQSTPGWAREGEMMLQPFTRLKVSPLLLPCLRLGLGVGRVRH